MLPVVTGWSWEVPYLSIYHNPTAIAVAEDGEGRDAHYMGSEVMLQLTSVCVDKAGRTSDKIQVRSTYIQCTGQLKGNISLTGPRYVCTSQSTEEPVVL